MTGKGATWNENHLVPITRHGSREEVYWTYSYSPIDHREAPFGVGGVLVLCTETTEQVLTASRLKKAEARWRALFHQAPGFTALLRGPEHVFEFANPNYFSLVGRDDIIGRKVADALPWAADQGFVAILDEVYRTGHPYEASGTQVSIPDPATGAATKRYLNFVYQPILDEAENISGIFVLGFDVTEGRLGAEALRISEDRLRLACDAAEIGIYDFDVRNDVLNWDARIRELWGVPPDAALSYREFLRGLHPDDVDATNAAVERALDPNGDGSYLAEYRVINASTSQTHWVQATGRTTFDEGGPVRLIGTTRDITQEKEATQRRDEFLATLGHELRNPLAPIGNALHLLNQKGLSEEHAERMRRLIERQLHQMVHILDDLLDVVRVTRGRIELRREFIRLAEVVDAALEIAEPIAACRIHPIELRKDADPTVFGDRTRLAQVVSNLVINACKYSDADGRIEIGLLQAGQEAVLSVRDEGIGIDANHKGRIFDMFSQAQRSIERSEGGLGIGLALARGLVELHGGTITVASDGPGKGSTFEVRLPVISAPSDQIPQAPDTMRQVDLAGFRIMVVDDNRDAALTFAEVLVRAGAEVRTAFDAQEAIRLADEFRPTAALLDLGLPNMNGYQLAEVLKHKAPGIRLFALTGYGQPSDQAMTSSAGFAGHFVKPTDPHAVLETLQKAARR